MFLGNKCLDVSYNLFVTYYDGKQTVEKNSSIIHSFCATDRNVFDYSFGYKHELFILVLTYVWM